MHDMADRCQRFSEGKCAALALLLRIQPLLGRHLHRIGIQMNVAQLRQEYMRSGLSEQDAGADPVRLFSAWLEDAVRAALPLPNAMTLATVSAEGAPDARIVLL